MTENDAPKLPIVETITNEEEQMQANVFANPRGSFNVMLKDLDSGLTCPGGFVNISNLKDAIECAKKLANVRG